MIRALRLREITASWYFWPSLALIALAAGMAVWAVTLSHQNSLGQVIWSVFFGLIASILMVLAFRESRPEPLRRSN